MAWTDPKTMGHEPALYSDWNTYIRDNTNYLYSKLMIQAWVNFNGTGTVAINASYNVSSITDNGTGLYTVNFTSAIADANYGWSASATDDIGGDINAPVCGTGTKTVSALQIKVFHHADTGYCRVEDKAEISVIVVR